MSLPLHRRAVLRLGAAGASAFILSPAQGAGPVIRRNAVNLPLHAPDNAALVAGMLAIQNLPPENPLSYYFQANIHLTRDDPKTVYPGNPNIQALAGALWNNCPHGVYYFLAWHRLYVHFMERIIRRFSGYSAFAMPYWNYATEDPNDTRSRQLPEIYRQQTYLRWFNPLWIADNDPNLGVINGRDPRLNAGGAANLADVSIAVAFGFTNFTGQGGQDFGGHPPPATILFGGLELTPHNTMHTAVGGSGGLMNNLFFAARDPIFFAHHSNIDRLWESWLRLGGGRSNPLDDAQWLSHSWPFIDEFGNVVTRSAADALDTAGQLGYVYEDYQPAPSTMMSGASIAQASIVVTPAQSSNPVVLTAGRADLPLLPQTAAISGPPGLTLQFIGLAANGSPGANWSIYLNLPAGAAPDPSSPYFAGTLSFLGAVGHAAHHGAGAIALDVSACIVRQAGLGVWRNSGVVVTLIENLPTDAAGRPMPSNNPASVTIEAIRLGQGAVAN